MDGVAVGRVVHYVSYGTPGGEYPSVCRAAIITEVLEPYPAVSLCVLNPTGMFFNQNVPYDDHDPPVGGSWHWPERI